MSAFEVIGDSADREAWLALRRSGVGASDTPAILGLVGWASAASIQASKWGLVEEADEAEVVRWGRRLEAAIIAGLGADEGWQLQHYGKLLRSTQWPWMLCTPDALRDDGIFVQIKNTMKADAWSDEVPPAVNVQCQHEMAVTGANLCVAAALIFGNRLRWGYVERDDDMIRQILEVAREFHEMTERMEPMPADGSEHTRRAYQLLWPQDTGETVALDGHFLDLDAERCELQSVEKAAKERLDAIDNEIRLALKDATYGVLPNGTSYSLKAQTRKAYAVKETTFRSLRRKEWKR